MEKRKKEGSIWKSNFKDPEFSQTFVYAEHLLHDTPELAKVTGKL
jgi:hypothetical protein